MNIKKRGLVMNKKINDNKINKILYLLLFISFIFLPIDNFPFFGFAGEIGRRLGLYPFVIIIPILIYMIFKNKSFLLNKKNPILKFILIFYSWTFISILININNILENSFKGRTGIEKLILQILVITFMIILSYSTFYIIENNKLGFKDIRKFILASFILVAIYCTFELINLLNIYDFSGIIKTISYFVHNDNRGIVYERGIRGLSGEASYFGMYISFILPWIFSYLFTEKKIKYVFLFIYMLIITFFTKSRFAIAIIYMQVFLYFILYIYNFKTKIDKKKLVGIFVVLVIILGTAVNSIYDRGGHDKYGNSASGISITQLIKSMTNPNNYSNLARTGLMKTAVNMGIDNPVFGVGLGQYAFYASDYIDEKSLISHEVQNWLNDDTDAWTPAFSLHLRVLAEQGVVGFLIWISMWMYTLISLFKIWRTKDEDYYGLTLIVSICGVLASGFNADTYAFSPYWILLALSTKYLKDNISN